MRSRDGKIIATSPLATESVAHLSLGTRGHWQPARTCMHEGRSDVTPYLLQKDVSDELSYCHALALRAARLELLGMGTMKWARLRVVAYS